MDAVRSGNPHSVPADSAAPRPVTVVILTWNGLEFTKPCLESVLRNTDLSQVEVVVVDNGSTDGTVQYLRARQDIITLFNAENLGFVRGNNEALKRIDTDRDVILLNNDTKIDDPDWIAKLQGTAYGNIGVGVVGCRIRRIDEELLQHAGTYIPDRTYWGQQLGAGERDVNQFAIDRDVEGVVFACVLITRAAMNAVGFLDEDYFSYYEDSDYCLKVRAAGMRVMNCGSLTILHMEHGSTSTNAVSHSHMFQRSQKTFLTKWKNALDARYVQSVHLISTFSQPIGYAMTARQIALVLESSGVRVSYEYLYGPGTVFSVPEDRNRSTGIYQLEVIKQRNAPPAEVPRLIYGQADAFGTIEAKYKIGYTMLETTGVPQSWVDGCNDMDELLVPTAFNAWTFRRSGVSVPIRVVPLSLVDTDHFNPRVRGYKMEGVFTFLSIFEWGERKSPEILLKAFNRAFRSEEPVVLLCKFSNRDPGVNPEAIIGSLGLDPAGGRIIYSENEPTPYYQVAQLYRSADCFVLPTRGEGWGMPIVEAMACGLPVIASYWSAQQSYMDDENSYPLQVSLVDAEAKCPYYDGFKWAEPDEDHLVTLLRKVYEHPAEAAQKGERAARDVEENWSLRQGGVQISEALRESGRAGGPGARGTERAAARPPRIAIDVSRAIGNEVSGIGRYTTSLVRGLADSQVRNGRRFDYLLLPGFAGFVHPMFRPGIDEDAFGAVRGSAMTMYRGPLPAFGNSDQAVPGIDLVYCTGNAFPEHIDTKAAMVVYDTSFLSHPQFHTQENVDLCASNFQRAVDRGAHFIAISHSSREDFIRYYGVAEDRVTTIYCGVDLRTLGAVTGISRYSVRHKYGLPDEFFLYVGSMEPRKNLETLLHAMARYRGPEKLVVVGASGWNNDGILKTLRLAGDRVQVLGYVPQRDLPALYTLATALVYPSLYEGFGLPVVEAMAAQVPVITSNNSSLSEIGQGACELLDDPMDPDAIKDILEKVARDIELRSRLIDAGIERSRRFSLEEQAIKHTQLISTLIGERP